MLVVKIYMWPGGDQTKERLLSQASLTNTGVAAHDDAKSGVSKGERRYVVKLFKGTQFHGPSDNTNIGCTGKVWRRGTVRGHKPGKRGEWDLLGGALRVLLGDRLDNYADAAKAPREKR